MKNTTAHVTTCLPIRRRKMCPAGSQHPLLATKLTTGHRPLATGFTLIEMLVVVTIMMIMVAAAATMMQPASDSRRLRETARAVNVYLSSARNRAMETGRPCGVIFRHYGTLTCAMTADQCEVPPSYSGDSVQSTATVTISGSTITAVLSADDSPYKLLRNGDLIQFNCQGPCYAITNPNDTVSTSPTFGFITGPAIGAWSLTCNTGGQLVPWTSSGTTVPYRIFRSPVKGGATPLQLPASAVVDLAWSGYGSSYLDTTTAMDYTVMFSPNGSVECVYEGSYQRNVTQPIYLLIGKRERVGQTGSSSANPAQWGNWQDPAGYWVVVNPQTGMVSTSNIAVASSATVSTGIVEAAGGARYLAAQAQSIGGK